MRLLYAARTDVGMIRSGNEDNFTVDAIPLGLNAAKLYGIDIAAQKKLLAKEQVPARIAVAA